MHHQSLAGKSVRELSHCKGMAWSLQVCSTSENGHDCEARTLLTDAFAVWSLAGTVELTLR